MKYCFIIVLSVLFVLVQGSHVSSAEQETYAGSLHAEGTSSKGPISFPTVRSGRAAVVRHGQNGGHNGQSGGSSSNRRSPPGASSGRPYGNIHHNHNRNHKDH
ncbi:uncharacterized protein [Drosophila bipectinata]|uniref:uncharacterized protein n=1 Tax=Drosophila bipectinata TaxID=42026 RepID=UPI0038B305DE